MLIGSTFQTHFCLVRICRLKVQSAYRFIFSLAKPRNHRYHLISHCRRDLHPVVGVRLEDAADHGRVLLAALLPQVPAKEALAAGLPEAVVSGL